MVHLTLPTGDYSIRAHGNQIEIISLDRELSREEVAAQLGRTERSIDLYRNLPAGPLQLKSRRTGGRIYIKESELRRWLAYLEEHPDDYPISDRPRKKRRTRLVEFKRRARGRTLAENAERLSRAA